MNVGCCFENPTSSYNAGACGFDSKAVRSATVYCNWPITEFKLC